MADPAVSDFIRAALGRGLGRAEIEAALRDAGWPQDTVRDAMASFADVDFPVPVPRPRPYLSAREAFLTIVLFIALGLTVTNLGVLLFQFVNLALPDPTASEYVFNTVASRMRWSVSALVVAFPLFLFLSIRMEKERRANPALRDSRIRKWLTYAALVIAAAVIMGDLMAAIYQFLGGEMTLRFALKVAIIGLIAGTTFLHYIGAVEDDGAEANDETSSDRGARQKGLRRQIGYATTAIATASVVAALLLIDSPERMRLKRIDERRLADLSDIATVVDCYWTVHGEVPANMTALENAIREMTARRALPSYCHWTQRFDPETGAPYELQARGADGFALCADFANPWPAPGATAEPIDIRAEKRFAQTRPAGRHCYELTARNLDFDE